MFSEFHKQCLGQRGAQDCGVGLQNVYANMEGNVLVHISAPALGLSAAHWAVVSWAQSQLTRESVYEAKYIYRCDRQFRCESMTLEGRAMFAGARINPHLRCACRLPKEIVLQQGQLSKAARHPKPSTVARFTAALKRAGIRFQASRADAGARRPAKRASQRSSVALQPQTLQEEGEVRSSSIVGTAKPGTAADQQPAGTRTPSPLLLY